MTTKEARQTAVKLAQSGDLDSAYRTLLTAQDRSKTSSDMFDVPLNRLVLNMLKNVADRIGEKAEQEISATRTEVTVTSKGYRILFAMPDRTAVYCEVQRQTDNAISVYIDYEGKEDHYRFDGDTFPDYIVRKSVEMIQEICMPV